MPDRRRKGALVLLALAALLIWDATRSPDRQITAELLIAGVRLYQGTLSRAMPALGVTCRFEPSCSHYAIASIRRYGAAAGGWRSVVRLVRCGPWTPAGTSDPP